MTSAIEILRAVHIGVGLESALIVLSHARPVVQGFWTSGRSEAALFLFMLWLLWTCVAMLWTPLAVVYLVYGSHPTSPTNLPDWWRVAANIGLLTVGAFFIAIRGKDGLMWPRFWLWSGLMAVLLIAVLAHTLPGLP